LEILEFDGKRIAFVQDSEEYRTTEMIKIIGLDLLSVSRGTKQVKGGLLNWCCFSYFKSKQKVKNIFG
jgi:hypothetical protein